MPKCSDCGLLAVWLPSPNAEFREASLQFRESAYFSQADHQGVSYHARCFVRAQDLSQEVLRWKKGGDPDALATLRTIDADRVCQSFTPWLQGFSPKEHAEMQFHETLRSEQRRHEERSLQFHETLRNEQRRHENLTLLVAMVGVGASLVGIAVGAYFNHEAAQIEADATRDSARQQIEATNRQTTRFIEAQREATQMQIDAQKALAPPVPATTHPNTKPAPPAKTEPRP